MIDSGKFNLYDGFEPSGRMHIAQGVFKAMNVNKCTSSGGRFIFWVADWFALMNDKMGGDLEKIKVSVVAFLRSRLDYWPLGNALLLPYLSHRIEQATKLCANWVGVVFPFPFPVSLEFAKSRTL